LLNKVKSAKLDKKKFLIQFAMRILVVFLLIIIFQFSYGQNLDAREVRKSISKTEKASHENKLYKSSGVQALNNYDILYHRCEWQIDPAIDSIHGAIKTLFKPLVTGFSKLEFDLTSTMQVDSVLYHGSSISFTQTTTDILEITFPQTIALNALDSVTVIYHGKPISTGQGSWGQSIHNGIPIIWTLSEPYGAKDWWPCKQNLLDKIDSIDIVVTTPASYRVASNGALYAETIVGLQKRYEWRHRHPIAAYLVAIAVTNYVHYSDFAHTATDTIEILNYVFPEDSLTSVPILFETVKILEFFDSLLVPYPFANEKYGHAQIKWTGGMEHQTMTFIDWFSWGLITHELAHQWFGNHVTCGSWEDIWLNEGFASYLVTVYVERENPALWRMWLQSDIDYITDEPDGSVLCDDTTSISRIFDDRLTYAKGAYLLHMLRWQVGDSAFFAGLRNYLNDPLLQAGFARTGDLQNHLEQVSGQNLTTFFDQWYYKQGYPSYIVSWFQDTSSVWLMVNQSQSNSSVSFFTMPIPIRFYGNGQDTTIVFNHTFSGQQFSADIAFQIDSVVFDPDLWILSNNNTVAIGTLENEVKTISVYPNPADNRIIVEGVYIGTELNIFDISGRVVFTQIVTSDMIVLELNISSLSSGTYLLQLKTETGEKSIQIVVK
jgi:aminopeptidase N